LYVFKEVRLKKMEMCDYKRAGKRAGFARQEIK
jgi:hypothetical protein